MIDALQGHDTSCRRKGQFFIIGVVLILFSLMALNTLLNQHRGVELSNVEHENLVEITRQIDHDVYETIASSSREHIKDDLNLYMSYKKNTINDYGFSLDFSNNFNYYEALPYDINVTYSVDTSDMHIEKKIVTNTLCIKYEHDGECNNLSIDTDGTIDNVTCCSRFNICC